MNYRDFYSYQMILRVGDFGVEQAASFPPASLGGQLFAIVIAAAPKLEQHFTKQSLGRSAVREGTTSKAVGRAALRQAVERMRDTARSMSRKMPEIEAKFRLPRSQSDQALIVTAETFAADAIPVKDDFIRYAMPADFLEELGELITEFRNAVDSQQTGEASRVRATAEIEDTLEEAIAAVQELNAIVRNTFADEPGLLATWTSARHVQRLPRTKETPVAPQLAPEPITPPPAS